MLISQFDYSFAKYLYDKFKDIYFDDKKHVYFNTKTGRKLLSVTQCIKLFEPKFESDYWATRKAIERGVTKDDILKEWDDIKKLGLERGNIYHNYIESKHKRLITDEVIPEIESYISDNSDIPFLSEFIIGNEVIGGKPDHLAIRDNHLVLVDWKTNKKFTRTSQYKLCNGLEHLDNTEYHKYALQLSLYRYILDIDDIKEMEIVWFNDDTYEVISMPYLQDEAKHIINHVNSTAYSNS